MIYNYLILDLSNLHSVKYKLSFYFPHRDRLVLLIRDLKAEAARVVGAWVEDKGLLVALHYR